MTQLAASVLRVSALGLYLFVSYTLHVTNPAKVQAIEDLKVLRTVHRYSFRYLTNWTFTLQLFYLVVSLFATFLGVISAQKLKRRVENVNDYIFTSISTPMSMLVSIIFWSVYSFNRELIFPKILDLLMPFWVNHTIHTLNSVIAIVDLCLVPHKFYSWKKSLNGLLAYVLAYSICLFGTYFQTGEWLYPLLAALTWPLRGLFCVIVVSLAMSMLALTRGINSLVWGHEKTTKQPHKHKST